MNKILILLLIILISACNKNDSTNKNSEITEIYLNYSSSLVFGKSQTMIKKHSENEYLYIKMTHVMDSLKKVNIEENSCEITKKQFDNITYLIKRIDEKNIIEHKKTNFLDGASHQLIFGDGINFKHYKIRNPFSLKRQNIEEKNILDSNYIQVLDKIYGICNIKN